MISEPSVIPVILSLFWFGAAIFGLWCILVAVARTIQGIYRIIVG